MGWVGRGLLTGVSGRMCNVMAVGLIPSIGTIGTIRIGPDVPMGLIVVGVHHGTYACGSRGFRYHTGTT